MRFVVFAIAVAACYAPTRSRQEHTTVSDDARPVLADVIAPGNPHAKDRDAFQRHYSAALDAYRHGDYAIAIAEFEASYAIDAQPILIFNIAQSYRRAGQLDKALSSYRDYLDRDPSAERDHVTELIENVERERAEKR